MSYQMSDLLQLMVSEGGADLHIRVNIPPVIRIHGILQRVDGPPLRPEDTEELMRSITSEDHIQQSVKRVVPTSGSPSVSWLASV
jgi:twitching motility protein PilT